MNFNLIKESDKYINLISKFSDLVVNYYPAEREFCDISSSIENSKKLNELFPSTLGIISIVNFATKAYLYISPNVTEILGRAPISFIKGGLIQSIDLFTDSQKNILVMQIFPEMFGTFLKYSSKNLAKNLRISYTTLLMTPSGGYKWFLHQISVLETGMDGMPVLGVKHFIDIHHIKNDKNINFSIDLKNDSGEYVNIYHKSIVDSPLNPLLSLRETELVQYLEMGFSAKQIADKMGIAENTVSNHRKKIFKKYGVNSSLELLYLIHNQNLQEN